MSFDKTLLFLPLIVLVGCAISNSGQSHKPSAPVYFNDDKSVNRAPFQVIHAKNVSNQNGEQIDQKLQLIGIDDTVFLEDGHLMLAHHLGEFFEFTGDTTIIIWDVLYHHYGYVSSEIKARYNIDGLVDPEAFRYISGAVMRSYDSELEFVMMDSDESIINIRKGQSFCLRWQKMFEDSISDEKGYQLVFKNIFDDVVHTVEASGNSMLIEGLEDINSESGLMIFHVRTRGDEPLKSRETAVTFIRQPGFHHPTKCDVSNSAIKCLETAFLLDHTGGYKQAEQFYKDAASVSDKKIYDDLLAGYYKRIRRHE
ncbi:MAG: hypothetical protein AAFQ94_11835 [Bacteroidota bacterium]